MAKPGPMHKFEELSPGSMALALAVARLTLAACVPVAGRPASSARGRPAAVRGSQAGASFVSSSTTKKNKVWIFF